WTQTLTRVTGVVEDATDAVVPGAVVTLVNRDSGEAHETVTDSTGRFKIELAPGPYTVVARAGALDSGKKTIVVTEEPLKVKLRVRLELDEQVTVSASRDKDPLAPEANANAVVFDENLFSFLPIAGNDILPIVSAFLAPASAGANGTSILVDGIETD